MDKGFVHSAYYSLRHYKAAFPAPCALLATSLSPPLPGLPSRCLTLAGPKVRLRWALLCLLPRVIVGMNNILFQIRRLIKKHKNKTPETLIKPLGHQMTLTKQQLDELSVSASETCGLNFLQNSLGFEHSKEKCLGKCIPNFPECKNV